MAAETATAKFAVAPVLIYLTGYFLFGAGYIAYMTFMIAYVRDAGGGAAAQSAFWSLIGLSAFVTPWVWRRVLALDRGGLATTIILGTNAVGAALPIFGHSVSAAGLADRDCSHDDFIWYRPDAGADRRRRDHGRGRQPVVCAERLGRDAGAGRGAVGVSEEAVKW